MRPVRIDAFGELRFELRASRGHFLSGRARAGEHLAEDDAECVLVGQRGHVCACSLLGRHVLGRSLAAVLDETGFGTEHVGGEAEVGDHRAELAGRAADEHDVARFEIAVNDAVCMQRVQATDDLLEEIKGERRLHGTHVMDVFAQRKTVEELHAEEPYFGSGVRHAEQFVDTADVWMRDGARLFYLTAKALNDLGALGEVRADGLEGDSLAQLRVPRFVNVAHSAAGDESMNLKPPRDGAADHKR